MNNWKEIVKNSQKIREEKLLDKYSVIIDGDDEKA